MNADRMRQLEERVARLEEELRQVKAQLPGEPEKPWWERTAGMFEGSKTFEKIVRLGQQIRRGELELVTRRVKKKADKRDRNTAQTKARSRRTAKC